MPLNLKIGGNAVPHIRWMASTSSWNYSSEAGQQPFQFGQAIFDLAQVRTGWGWFTENEAPQWVWDPSIAEPASRPPEGEWKRGFRVMVLMPKDFGTERLREFATTGTGAVMGIDALYTAYEELSAQHPGKVPVVAFRSATPTKVGKGQTCVPNFELVGWVERPEGLDQASEPQGQTAQPTATTPAATSVAPPAPAAPQPAQPDPMLETQF